METNILSSLKQLGPRNCSRGMTLVELLVAMSLVFILVGILLPAVLSAREASRRMACSNNFKQVGLAVLNYHSAYRQLPRHGTGTWDDNAPNGWTRQRHHNSGGLSAFVSIVPFIEQQAVWEQISSPLDNDNDGIFEYPAMGPHPSIGPHSEGYTPWRTEIPTYRCPSDPVSDAEALLPLARLNFGVCLGDSYQSTPYTKPIRWSGGGGSPFEVTKEGLDSQKRYARGAFVHRRDTSFKDIKDGLSNTILMGEIPAHRRSGDARTRLNRTQENVVAHLRICDEIGHLDKNRPLFWCDGSNCPPPSGAGVYHGDMDMHNRGLMWMSAYPASSGFFTNLPPNQELCVDRWIEGGGLITAGSHHPGGAHVLMADGAVMYHTDSIDTGHSKSAAVKEGEESPFGVWGALGTRDAHEAIVE